MLRTNYKTITKMVFQKVRLASCSPSVKNGTSIMSSSPVHLMSISAFIVGILVLIILVVAPLEAQPLFPAGNSPNFEYKRYCSNSLADVIRLLCGGRFSSQQYAQYQSVDNSDTLNSNNLRNDGIYFRSLQTERISECCLRPCGYSELKMYCAPA